VASMADSLEQPRDAYRDAPALSYHAVNQQEHLQESFQLRSFWDDNPLMLIVGYEVVVQRLSMVLAETTGQTRDEVFLRLMRENPDDIRPVK
jgi:hypothetical protein